MKLVGIHVSKRFGWVEATLVNEEGRTVYRGNIREILKLAARKGWAVEGVGEAPAQPETGGA